MDNEISELKNFLTGLKSMEKDLVKMSSELNVGLTDNFEKMINQHFYEAEKKMKINKKEATVSLAKDGSVKIVFDNPDDGRIFFEGKK